MEPPPDHLLGALRCERLLAQPGNRRPHRARTDPGIPPGQAQQAVGGLLGDGGVVIGRRPGWSPLGLRGKRRRRRLGSTAGAEEHLRKRDRRTGVTFIKRMQRDRACGDLCLTSAFVDAKE